jgi:hypothetical protein
MVASVFMRIKHDGFVVIARHRLAFYSQNACKGMFTRLILRDDC